MNTWRAYTGLREDIEYYRGRCIGIYRKQEIVTAYSPNADPCLPAPGFFSNRPQQQLSFVPSAAVGYNCGNTTSPTTLPRHFTRIITAEGIEGTQSFALKNVMVTTEV